MATAPPTTPHDIEPAELQVNPGLFNRQLPNDTPLPRRRSSRKCGIALVSESPSAKRQRVGQNDPDMSDSTPPNSLLLSPDDRSNLVALPDAFTRGCEPTKCIDCTDVVKFQRKKEHTGDCHDNFLVPIKGGQVWAKRETRSGNVQCPVLGCLKSYRRKKNFVFHWQQMGHSKYTAVDFMDQEIVSPAKKIKGRPKNVHNFAKALQQKDINAPESSNQSHDPFKRTPPPEFSVPVIDNRVQEKGVATILTQPSLVTQPEPTFSFNWDKSPDGRAVIDSNNLAETARDANDPVLDFDSPIAHVGSPAISRASSFREVSGPPAAEPQSPTSLCQRSNDIVHISDGNSYPRTRFLLEMENDPEQEAHPLASPSKETTRRHSSRIRSGTATFGGPPSKRRRLNSGELTQYLSPVAENILVEPSPDSMDVDSTDTNSRDNSYIKEWTTVETSEDLRFLDFVYHPHLKLLICKFCQSGVFTSSEKKLSDHVLQPSHLGSRHKSIVKSAAARVFEAYESLPVPSKATPNTGLSRNNLGFPLPDRLIPPIPHLQAPEPGFQCFHCSYVCRSWKTMSLHYDQNHLGEDKTRVSCEIQRLFGFGSAVSFRVSSALHVDSSAAVTNVLLDAIKFHDQQALVQEEESAPTGNKELCPLLASTKWHKVKGDLSAKDLRSLISLPAAESAHPLASLQGFVQGYFYSMLDPLDQSSSSALKWLVSYSKETQGSHKFSLPSTKASIDRYCRAISQFILFTYCALEGAEKYPVLEHYQFPRPTQLAHTMAALTLALKSHDRSQPAVSSECVRRIAKGEPIEHILVHLPTASTSEQRIQDAIHDLLFALFTMTIPSNSQQDTLLVRFIVAHVLKSDGRWDQPGEISPKMAHLVTCLRAVIFFEAFKNSNIHPEKDMASLIQDLLQWTTLGQATTFDTLQNLVFQMCALQKTIKSFPNVIWDIPSGYKSLTLYGQPIDMADLQKLVQDNMAKLEYHLHCAILRNLPEAEMNIDIGAITDRPDDRSPGFSFLSKPENDLRRFEMTLIKHFTKHSVKTASGQPYFGSEWEKEWATTPIMGWLADVNICRDMLLVAIHTTCGQPCRGEELVSCLIQNKGSKLRNFFFRNKRFIFAPQYHKGFSRSKTDLFAPRLLGEKLSKLLLEFLVIVLPAERYFLDKMKSRESEEFCSDPELIALKKSHLAMGSKGIMSAAYFSQLLRNHSEEHLKTSLGVRYFRQLMIAVGRVHIDAGFGEVEEEEETTTTFDAQAGHTSQTARRIYAVTPHVLREEEDRELQEHFAISEKWANFVLRGVSFIDAQKRAEKVVPETLARLQTNMDVIKQQQVQQQKEIVEATKQLEQRQKDIMEATKQLEQRQKEIMQAADRIQEGQQILIELLKQGQTRY